MNVRSSSTTFKPRARLAAPVLTLILGESELEPVPESLHHHPAVRATLKKRGKARVTILDGNVHHDALKALPEGERRGRPDLPHYFLVMGLDSLAAKKGDVRVVIHTRNDERITVSPQTRIMRNYPRFIGLMEQLWAFRSVPKDPPLLAIEEGWSLERVVAEHKTGPVVTFTPSGRRVRLREFVAEKAAAGDLTVVLGGFPKGDWHKDPKAYADDVVSVTDEHLSVWTVETQVLSFWEDARGFLQ